MRTVSYMLWLYITFSILVDLWSYSELTSHYSTLVLFIDHKVNVAADQIPTLYNTGEAQI